ncbi:MAG TPA: hypothetical protein DCF89_11875 [Flavobacteriales bacterium]|nr:hypothetical protein [Crocinitomicaceae bacterium]HAE31805.1 hypothetical protein [Flavobacteriales bacterium]
MKRILILALICSFGSLYSQDDDNLVINPSFESVKGKLKKQKQISIATNWESPTELPADLFSTKVKEIVSAPKNVYGKEAPLEGENYAGIVALSYNNKEPRTYLQTELRGALKKGTQYCLKFNVSLADKSKYSSNNIGAYVTQKRFEVEGKSDIIFDSDKDKNKVIRHPENKTFDARYNWETVCNAFTASGKEKFLIIGNFFNFKECKFKKLKKPTDLMGQQIPVAYYYIDQVELFVMEDAADCDCIKKVEEKDRILYHKQVTAEGGMSIEDQVKYSTIYFDWVKSSIDESMGIDLRHLVELLVSEKGKDINLIIQGHYGVEESSFIEQNEYLKGLDVKRAEKIKEYLVKNGVSADRMEVVGKGKEALANEGTEEYQKAQNRMVDFIIK